MGLCEMYETHHKTQGKSAIHIEVRIDTCQYIVDLWYFFAL